MSNVYRSGASFFIIAFAILGIAGPAVAHPLGNFTINHLAKIAIRGERLDVRYVLDFAEIPTFQITRALDAQARPSGAQLRSWAQSEIAVVQAGLRIEAGGEHVWLHPDVAHVRTRPGAGGLPTVYWTDDLAATLPALHGTRRRISITDGTYAGRIGWKDIVVAPAQEPTHQLLRYPVALLASPRDVTGVEISLDGARVTAAAIATTTMSAAVAPISQVRSNTLSNMLSKGTASAPFVLLTLLVAIGLGALHALEPGHGKTLLAVSLVGARANAKQAVVLASALTIAHTAGVVLLGVALLFVANWFVPEHVYPWITLGSGIAVAMLGGRALAHIVRARRGSAHAHEDGHGHTHGLSDHGHAHGPIAPDDKPISFAGAVIAAATGNIAPCPAALVVLLTALTLHQIAYGLVVIVAFSIGLASILTGLGIGIVHGAKWIARSPAVDRIARHGPLLSALAISTIGALMIGQGLAAGSVHVPALVATALVLAAIAGFALGPGHTHTSQPA